MSNSKGGGSPLPDEVLKFMEPRFGADFSSVRVHTDFNAAGMNKELGAQAFAHGSHIYYGTGKSPGKDELTAHELTHTVNDSVNPYSMILVKGVDCYESVYLSPELLEEGKYVLIDK